MTAITAIGTANPPFRQHQNEIFEIMTEALQLTSDKRRLFKSIMKATGIEYRHSVLTYNAEQDQGYQFFPANADHPFPSTASRMSIYKKTALPLAMAAINDCLSSFTEETKNQITDLIVISCTGMYAPGLDIDILNALQLPSTTQRTDIHFMGCYASFNGMRIADAICKANPKAKVLMVSIEICSLHFQKRDTLDDLMASALFADGAAAVLIEASTQQNKYLTPVNFYSDIVPDTHNDMSWDIGDQGFNMVLSGYVPQAVESGINTLIKRLLADLQLQREQIDFFAIHPGGFKILQACENSLDITPQQNQHSYHVLRNYGNMSSATVLFVLKSLWESLSPEDNGKNIFSCAFGPGLTVESSLLRLSYGRGMIS